MKKNKGVISAFLALIFLLVAALIAVTLESTRAACLDYLAETAARSGLESVFAAFDSDVLNEHGLLTVRGREGGRLTWPLDAERYARAYFDPAGGSKRSGDRVGLSSLSVRAKDSVFITEDNGKIFVDAVMDYMKSAGIGIMLKETLERLGLFDEDGALTFSGSLQRFLGSDEFSLEDILKDYGDLKGKAEDLISAAQAAAEEGGEEGREDASSGGGKVDLSGTSLSELLDELKLIRDGGILGFVTGNSQISALAWTDAENPSRLPEAEKALHSGLARADYSFDETLLLGEYLMNTMRCYTEQGRGGHRYEAEYVITGKQTERAALAAIAADLMLIRTGLNFAYLCTDSEKQAAAETLALSVMTALAVPELTVVLKWLLITAWAAAEAVADLRALFQGKRVVLWKSKSSWKLLSLSLESAEQTQGFSIGLGYRDYLRLLFYLHAGPGAAYRMMDVIQARQKQYRYDFRMREYMVSASLTMTAEVTTLYLQYPAFRRLSGAGFGRRYSKTAACSY